MTGVKLNLYHLLEIFHFVSVRQFTCDYEVGGVLVNLPCLKQLLNLAYNPFAQLLIPPSLVKPTVNPRPPPHLPPLGLVTNPPCLQNL